MAKKSRRARRQQRTPKSTFPQPKTTKSTHSSTAESSSSSQVDFSSEYHYVITDLRNMAVIAAIMLGVLVALSVVIR